MSSTENKLLSAFVLSLFVAILSMFFYVVAYISLGSPLDRDPEGCVSRVLVDEGDRYISVCPDDTITGKIAAFLAPKAAVASVLLLAIYAYKRSGRIVSKKL